MVENEGNKLYTQPQVDYSVGLSVSSKIFLGPVPSIELQQERPVPTVASSA